MSWLTGIERGEIVEARMMGASDSKVAEVFKFHEAVYRRFIPHV